MRAPGRRTSILAAVAACCALLVAGIELSAGNDAASGPRPSRSRAQPTAQPTVQPTTLAAQPTEPSAQPAEPTPPATLPGGRTEVFDRQLLVAYYGTAGTGALGVLGEASPARIWPRLVKASKAFRRPGRRVQPVFELIVSIATSHPGPDGDHSTDISRAKVRRYLRAAHRHGALLVLDLQPGRSSFLRVAKRWAWALKDPWVGLALDPEWRMGRHQRPGRVIGSVDAREVNRVSRWLNRLTARHRLPQKVFMVHQFRASMVRHPGAVRPRRHLALVQHVDGFGTPRQKLATYHAVLRPGLWRPGFKLFYDEDVRRMSAERVLRIRPRVRFVSFQ